MLGIKRSGGQSGKYLTSKKKVNDGERERGRFFKEKPGRRFKELLY